MINLGDIIIVLSYKDVNGDFVSAHPLIVVNTKGGKIEGLDFNLIGCFASSFKNLNHKKRVLSFDCNIPVSTIDGVEKEGFIKANVIHFFDEKKLDYVLVGSISEEVYDKLIETIERLSVEGKIEHNTNNL